MTIFGGKNVLHLKSEIEKKNDLICESENKTYIIEKKIPPAPSRCYYADKNIKHCDNKTSFKNVNNCTDPGIKTSICIPNLRRKNRIMGIGEITAFALILALGNR